MGMCPLGFLYCFAPKCPLGLTTSGFQTLTFLAHHAKLLKYKLLKTDLLCVYLFTTQTSVCLFRYPTNCLTLLVSYRETQLDPPKNPSSLGSVSLHETLASV